MKRAARHKTGSVVFDKRRKTWNFLWWEEGKRRSMLIGTVSQHRTKASAWRAAKALQDALEDQSKRVSNVLTVNTLVQQYRLEKMPKRVDTRRSYEVWLRNHIMPRWGDCSLSQVQARPVELWLESLLLAPKSKAHIRGVLSILWDFAVWRGEIPMQRNPMELVTVKGATKRKRQPRSLTVEEFQKFTHHLEEPFRTMALLCCCLGLRISECLGLKWSDVDWINERLTVERGVVCQQVDDVKTAESRKILVISRELLYTVKTLKQLTQFSASEDWMFASPVQLGRLPWSYDQVWRTYQKAAGKAGIGGLGTHALRHTYRSWLDSVGTPVGVQQKLMRHADIRTTMNVYGDAASAEMAEAHGKIVRLALPQS
ncbi:MAG TPA: site-specific integrase [Candidatus Sulfotelmatobacter sp.]|jgi:integrase